MNIRPSHPSFWGLFYAALGGLFFARIFGAQPFIQDEAAGQAYFWNFLPFWETLFDPRLNDGIGRFRYVEYLSEALYWNLVRWHGFPRTLHDYSAIGMALAIAFLLKDTARRWGVSRGGQAVLLAFFLLSAPVYMTILFHYRKAKMLAGLFLAVFFWMATYSPRPKRSLFVLVVSLGFFTDPLFIISIPCVALALDHGKRPYPLSQATLWGLGLGAMGALLLNGLVGPAINPLTQLVFHIPEKPDRYFNINNLNLIHGVFSDLVWPLSHQPAWLNRGLTLAIAAGTIVLAWRRQILLPAALVPLLFLSVYVMRPAPHHAFYATYYGYPFLVVSVFAIAQWMSQARRQIPLLLALAMMTLTHAKISPTLLQQWRHQQLDTMKMAQSYRRDEILLNRILEGRGPKQIVWKEDSFVLYLLPFRTVIGTFPTEMSYLSRLVFPVLFQSEMERKTLTLSGWKIPFRPYSADVKRIAQADKNVPEGATSRRIHNSVVSAPHS